MARTGSPGRFLLLLITLGTALAMPPAGLSEEIPPADGASLVFVTKSDACDCVANLCVAGEQEVLNFLAGSGTSLRYERVDLAKDPGAGKTYRAVTLPVVLLLDGAGGEIARFDSFFTEAQLTGVWQQHLATRAEKP